MRDPAIAAERLTASAVLPARNSSVSTGPGATAFTRTPRLASSFDMARTRLSTAALVAQ